MRGVGEKGPTRANSGLNMGSACGASLRHTDLDLWKPLPGTKLVSGPRLGAAGLGLSTFGLCDLSVSFTNALD